MDRQAEIPERESAVPARSRAVSGLVVVAALVAVGIAFGSQWWKTPELVRRKAEIAEAIATAPTTAEGRLAVWLPYGNPQIHNCLLHVRLSAAEPWIVTHAVRRAGEEEVDFYGIDLAGMPLELARRDGLAVTVRLPAPRLVGRGKLAGDQARYVPVLAEGMRVPDPAERLRGIVLHALGELPGGLARDIPGATLDVVVGPGEGWTAP